MERVREYLCYSLQGIYKYYQSMLCPQSTPKMYDYIGFSVRLEVLTAVSDKSTVFWDMKLCTL
jgi:hypothetical protein